MATLYFRNPQNGYIEECMTPWIPCLFFGVAYFAYKGVWNHCFISFIFALFSGGLSWLIYPFFAKGIITKHYSIIGWEQVKHNDTSTTLHAE